MYFDRFPLISYIDNFDVVQRRKIVTDVLRRVRIKEVGKDESSFFVDYDLQEGDTPENISHRLYDTSSFFWVVLLVNEALNPYYDLSLDSTSLENYAKKKYFGKYFYLVDPDNEKTFSGLTFSPDETIFSSSDLLDDFGTRQETYNVRARIVSHEPTLGRIRVDGGEHTYFNQGSLIGVVRGSTIQQAKIKLIEDGLYALHHFGTGTADTLNPLASITGDVPIGMTSDDHYSITPPSLYESRIGVYLGLSGSRNTDYAITNFQYEVDVNETKRTIKLIHPDYIRLVVSGFEQLLQA